MSEPTPAIVVGDTCPNGSEPALSPEGIAELLADFRLWLMDMATPPAGLPQAPVESVDLFALVGQFTALRQEINLHTRAVRSQQEQNAETLRQNADVFQSLQQAQQQLAKLEEQARQQVLEENVRPMLKALVDVADSQLLAIRELTRTVQGVIELLPRDPDSSEAIESVPALPSGGVLARLFGVHRLAEYQRELAQHLESHRQRTEAAATMSQNAEQIGRMLVSALAGLRLGLQRMERAMRQFGLEPILAAGQPFDPEQMEAVEVVAGSDCPPGEVIVELRRGYLWKGKVFRFAQVRVAK
jgi:molecular chaperone GrpE